MCGRFALTHSAEALAEAFALKKVPDFAPRYNIAPSQPVAVVVLTDGTAQELKWMRWGLIPSWAKDPAIGFKLINARAETLSEKPSFRTAFKRRRCLVPADGFYEWQAIEGSKRKQPYFICMKDRQLFAFAGLWEEWQGEGDILQTCTIVTTAANELMKPIHRRMPAVIEPANCARWLDPDASPQSLQSLLVPFSRDALTAYPVSTLVNSPKNDGADCQTAIDGTSI